MLSFIRPLIRTAATTRSPAAPISTDGSRVLVAADTGSSLTTPKLIEPVVGATGFLSQPITMAAAHALTTRIARFTLAYGSVTVMVIPPVPGCPPPPPPPLPPSSAAAAPAPTAPRTTTAHGKCPFFFAATSGGGAVGAGPGR